MMFKHVLVLLFVPLISSEVEDRSVGRVRKKRYIVFPEGSTYSMSFCLTVALYTGIDNNEIFSEAINWSLNYDLPNQTDMYFKDLLFPQAVMQRRSRRDLYQKMETIMDSMGLNGRACIYRALCESTQTIFPKGQDMIEEILRTVFKFPLQRLLNSEPEEHRLYHRAQRFGNENRNCAELFPECPYSILNMAIKDFNSYVNDDT